MHINSDCTCENTHTRLHTHANIVLLQASGPLSDRSWEDQSSDFECTVKENNRREGVREEQIERQRIDKAHQDLY